MSWYLRACPVCGGDLFDGSEPREKIAVCFMCGRNWVESDASFGSDDLSNQRRFLTTEMAPPPPSPTTRRH
jgi:hypothetical protein